MKHWRHTERILILGASGKVGQMLGQYWVQNPPKNMSVQSQVRQNAGTDQIAWQLGDDPLILKPAKTVVALWGAIPGSGRSFDDNISLGLKALDTALEIGADRVFLASSSAVYGGAVAQAMTETSNNLYPTGAYGKSKLAMEFAAKDWVKNHQNALACCCFRISNVVGADSLFASLAQHPSITLDQFPSGGGPRRSYVTASDLARVIEGLSNLPATDLPELLNVAGALPVAMEDMAKATGADVTWRKAPATAFESVAMDTSRLASLLGSLDESANAERAIAAWRSIMGTT